MWSPIDPFYIKLNVRNSSPHLLLCALNGFSVFSSVSLRVTDPGESNDEVVNDMRLLPVLFNDFSLILFHGVEVLCKFAFIVFINRIVFFYFLMILFLSLLAL